MKYRQEILKFFNGMGAETFKEMLLDLARSDTFSALASGLATAEDTEQVIQGLQKAGVKPEWVENSDGLKLVVDLMTTKIMQRL